MNNARIYKPTKTAMQSGRANTKEWVLEFEPGIKFVEPLMGWVSSNDTTQQVRLAFPTQEAAIHYAKARTIPYEVIEPKQPAFKPKSYAANFAATKVNA